MNLSHGGPMRSPFAQANMSSSSLEGMERPVRSFKSFIKTVPPHPQPTQKPLPPTPPPRRDVSEPTKATPSPPVSTPPPASPSKSASGAPWKAPADWYEGAGTPPLPINRTLSPLLPEPSPLTADVEKESWLDADSLPAGRLLPIPERLPTMAEADPGPPRSPPRTPLPAPPTSKGTSDETPPARTCGKGEVDGRSPSPVHKAFLDVDIRYAPSPVHSIQASVASSASATKAFVPLGISPTVEQPHAPNAKPPEMNASPLGGTLNRQHLRGRLGALADDGWEDTDMDEKTRQLSISQDYHALLADQHQKTHVRAGGASSAGAQSAHGARPGLLSTTKHDELVPRPLSWQKSGRSTPRIPSTNRSHNSSPSRAQSPSPARGNSLQGKVQKRIASWVPHRLSVGPLRSSLQNTGPSPPARAKHKRKKSADTKPESKPLRGDLRFSTFFPKGKLLVFPRTSKSKTKGHPDPSTSPSKSPPSAPLIRLPGGFAVVRHSPTPIGEQVPPPRSSHPSSHRSLTSASDRTSDPDPRSSWSSANYNRTLDSSVPSGIAARTANTSSTYSRRSASSTSPTHPLALEPEVAAPKRTPPPAGVANPGPAPPTLPRPPLPPLSQSSLSSSPPLSPHAWNHLRSWSSASGDAEADEHGGKPGLFSKARQARRRHNRDARQERLKKSIRVLGPTDPGVVGSYVRGAGETQESMPVGERLPGYMVDRGA